MFFLLLFLYSIYSVSSLSNQEDLTISKYSQIGCLILRSDKQFLVNNIQENYLLPYQTLSSSHMTIELCFRLCRQWTILLSNNQTNCICLYTINKPYEFNRYLGEFSSINNCTSNDIQIYSLTENIYLLPTLLSQRSDDWSFDGCYYLDSLETIQANIKLINMNFIQALDSCRKHCQTIPVINHFSYFLSRKKSCYCLPIKYFQKTKIIAIRKPLIHCSFLSNICQGFINSCRKYSYEVNSNSLIKIDVHHYCLSTDMISLIFDRIFNMCLKSILIHTPTNISILYSNYKCLPLIIKTLEQWNYFIQSSWITYTKIILSIDRNSTYIFNDLFQYNNLTLISNELCISIMRTSSNNISYELISCSNVYTPAYILCAQKPFQSTSSYEEDFQIIHNQTETSIINEILSCPENFVLFNKICYYIHTSFVYNTLDSERLCYNQSINSTLVKFDSQERGNINVTKFLGRTFSDILLEFFYYILEKQLSIQSKYDLNKRNSLRLLIGDKNDPKECFLRYFQRSAGGFVVLHRCSNGGYPVCQIEPIRTKIISINQTISIVNDSIIETTTTTEIILFSSTNKTMISSINENNTTNFSIIADEDLVNNETGINFQSYNNVSIQTIRKHSKYQPLILILTGPILGLILLFTGFSLLIWQIRQNRKSRSNRSSIVGARRTNRSSTTVTINDIPNTPTVLYTRFNRPHVPLFETDPLLPSDNLFPNDDRIELLSANRVQIIDDELLSVNLK
ncbi:unnamed protein product [Adineta steineri]|uniref:Uncharacterized protein n=1 Tax=Adineta steineri TaxID=433720 RepID=A0A818Y179_9BILA|nr:unnamed protein product [Adineta steineri]